jgi:tetratricopeptide (TPR) repeat protein
MKKHYHLLIIAGFLAMVNGIQAQTPVLFKHSDQKTYFVQFERENRTEHNITNFMIRELARGNNKRLERTDFSYRFQYEVQLLRRGNRLTTHVDMRNFRFSGDTRYMGFEITDVLLPAQVEFTVQLFQGNKLVTELNQRPANVNIERNRYTIEYTDSLANDNNLRVVIPDFVFHYTSRNRSNFVNQLAFIDEYYATDASMQQMYGVLQSLDMYQLEYIRENQQQLQHIFAGISQIQSRDFYNVLRLWEYDPIAMVPKLNDIIALHQEQAQHMDYVMANLPTLYYERGHELLSSSPAQAREYFQASLQSNNSFAPAMLGMAQSFFGQGGNLNESINWIRRAYQVNTRDQQTNQELQRLSRDVESQLINQATGFERQNNHQEALRAWESVLGFCQSVPSIQCSDQVTRGIGRAHLGVYGEIFDNAQRFQRQGNLPQAEQFALQAIDYQKRNNNYIASADDAVRLLNDVKDRQYKNLVDQGRRDMGRQSFQSALNAFESAVDIERDYPVERDRQLSALVKQAKRPLLLADLESANAAVQRNQLGQANDLIRKIQEDVSNYDFAADNEILAKLENVRGQLQSQHCMNIQSLMDQLLNQANQYIMEGNFLAAEENFQEISYHNSQNTACGIGVQPMERRRAEVLPAITYQQTIEEVKRLINERRYSQAVDRYNDAGRQFQQQNLQRYRLDHRPVHEFSKLFSNDFVLHVAGIMANLGEGQNALNLVHHLDANGINARQMRSVQEITGRVLARADAATNPSWNPKQKVVEYTNKDRNLRFLRRAYVKQFKRAR